MNPRPECGWLENPLKSPLAKIPSGNSGPSRLGTISILAVVMGFVILGGWNFVSQPGSASVLPFPLALYGVDPRLPGPYDVTREFPAIAQAGFTIIHSYRFEGAYSDYFPDTNEAARKFLDAAQRSGLKVLLGFNVTLGAGEGKGYTMDEDLAYIRNRVIALKNHPALFGWQLYDEPDGSTGTGQEAGVVPPQNLRRAYQTIKTLDPAHPVSIASAIEPMTRDYAYADGFDLYMPDIFLIPPESFLPDPDYMSYTMDRLADWWDAARRLLTPKGKILMPHIQIYNLANDPPSWHPEVRAQRVRFGRYPTKEEMRFMSYYAIIHGSKGLSLCCYRWDYDGVHGPPEKEDVGPQANPEQWSRIKAVSQELKAMSPILTAPNANIAISITPPKTRIDYLVKDYQGKLFVIAANPSSREKTVTFALPQSLVAVKVLGESRSITPQGNSFADGFRGYEVHTYELKR